jgi:MscS family membrane protein
MSSFLKRSVVFLCLAVCATAWGQSLSSPLGQTAAKPSTGAASDPLGRDTPYGTVFGFLQTAQSGNYSTAAQYLQMSAAKRQTEGVDLATKLNVVVNSAFVGSLKKISSDPGGTPQDGVPLDQQNIGVLSAGDVETSVLLVHVAGPSGRIWLVSSETLAKVPEIYDQVQVSQVEGDLEKNHLGALVKHQFLGLAIWYWLAMLLAIPCAALLGWAVVQALWLPRYFWSRYRNHQSVSIDWKTTSKPLWLLLSTMIHRIFVGYLRIPLLPRHYYFVLAGVVVIIGFSWLMLQIMQQLMWRGRQRAILSGRMGTSSLMLLGQRILKAAIVVMALFAILGALGFNMTTALAGLGIGGIAVAFAAQKTLENLLGGISLLSDEVIRVGDVCKFGDRTGTVEDISLRSTSIRTPERTELSIPNGSLATMNVENLTRRDKILFNTRLSLHWDTTADQLRYVLAEMRRLFYQHPKVETNSARARLISFSDGAITVEVFCYILTLDGNEALAIQEDLLLRIMDIVRNAGTTLASPPQTPYQGRGSEPDKEKIAAVHEEVKKWRDAGKMPFPDFAPEEIAKISNSLPYPPPDSAAGGK